MNGGYKNVEREKSRELLVREEERRKYYEREMEGKMGKAESLLEVLESKRRRGKENSTKSFLIKNEMIENVRGHVETEGKEEGSWRLGGNKEGNEQGVVNSNQSTKRPSFRRNNNE